MSATSAEAPAGSRRESALGVAGIAAGLLLILFLFLWLWTSRGREIDAAEQLRGSFALEEVPAGWTVALAQAVPDSLFSHSSEVRIVRLVRADAGPDPEPTGAPDAKTEWKKLLEGAPLGEPARLHIAWYDPRTGSKDVERQLDSHAAVEMPMLDAQKGGIVRVDAGKLRWGTYDADFVQERLFEKGGFRDALRFNLSTPGQFCVLNVLWKWGEKGSRESAQRVLELFPPRPK